MAYVDSVARGMADQANSNIANILNSIVKGLDNHKYKIVAGVLKPDGVGGWVLLDDDDHTPINISSVVADSSKIRVTYSFTAKDNGIGSLVATPDETMVKAGFNTGASVGKTYADIEIGMHGVAGYFAWGGSSWSISNALGISSIAYSNGMITVTHQSCSGGGANAQCRVKTDLTFAYHAECDAITSTTTKIYLYDTSHARVTSASANADMRIFFSRNGGASFAPTAYTNTSGNIWVFGILEVE